MREPPPLSCRGFEPSLTPTLKQKSGVPRFFVLMVVREGIVLRRCACFGHSVAFCSPRFAFACLLTSNLRPSLKISPPEIFFASGPLHSRVGWFVPLSPIKKLPARGSFFNGGQRGDRTPDTRIFSPLLYQLSYLTIGSDCFIL